MIPIPEQPIVTAILHHMWSLARQHWQRQLTSVTPVQPACTEAHSATGQTSKTTEKEPTTLPAGEWNRLVADYNDQTIKGSRRQFPVAELLGAEAILARA